MAPAIGGLFLPIQVIFLSFLFFSNNIYWPCTVLFGLSIGKMHIKDAFFLFVFFFFLASSTKFMVNFLFLLWVFRVA